MPVHVAKRDGKYRVVDPNGKIAKNKGDTAADGGGHKSKDAAAAQARAINASLKRRNKI